MSASVQISLRALEPIDEAVKRELVVTRYYLQHYFEEYEPREHLVELLIETNAIALQQKKLLQKMYKTVSEEEATVTTEQLQALILLAKENMQNDMRLKMHNISLYLH